MTRPIILDLFCGAGGAGHGYQLAGFDVIGVDIEPHEAPFETIVADWAVGLEQYAGKVDAIHASPPCQGYSTATGKKAAEKWPRLIDPVRAALWKTGKPYIIENVQGARPHMIDPVRLCGSSFGLGVQRHRLFESNLELWAPPCDHKSQGTPVGVYGQHPDSREFLRPDGTRRGAKARSLTEGRSAMGIGWMDWRDLTESIPPAFTRHLGKQLIGWMQVRDHLGAA